MGECGETPTRLVPWVNQSRRLDPQPQKRVPGRADNVLPNRPVFEAASIHSSPRWLVHTLPKSRYFRYAHADVSGDDDRTRGLVRSKDFRNLLQ